MKVIKAIKKRDKNKHSGRGSVSERARRQGGREQGRVYQE